MRAFLKTGKRWLYVIHRWIGIASALLFAMWFSTGLVMMYVPYPSLSERERLAGLESIDWAQVQVTPGEAVESTGAATWPKRIRLEMQADHPVYRIWDEERLTVSARDGRRLTGVGGEEAIAIAKRFRGWNGDASVRTLERDQWTVAGGYDPNRPLHKVTLADKAGSALYVSSKSGEVVLDTSRFERVWNWVGTVPHWIYFTEIRKDQPLWRQVILWTSGAGIVAAITGVWLGLLRLKLRGAKSKMSPYRGWMKWHHVGGLVTGLTVTTWIVSGWLSVNPNDWFAHSSLEPAALARYSGGDASFPFDPATARLPVDVKEARFIWVAGRPEVILSDGALRRTVLDGATGAPVTLDDAALFSNAAKLLPGAAMTLRSRLDQEDIYWYGHHAEVQMPVLRVGFADEAQTWFHINPVSGEVLASMNRSDRTERWAFNFLHAFDLPILLHSRPSWDVLIWTLSIGGLVTSVTSVVIGWRRLKRKNKEIQTWRRKRAQRKLTAAE